MGHYTNKCFNEINKGLFYKRNGSRLTISLLMICLSSLSPALPSSLAPQQELLKPWQVRTLFTSSHPPSVPPPPVRPLTPLLPAVHLEALAPACVCWLAVCGGPFICSYLHEWLVTVPSSFQERPRIHAAAPLFIFKSQINSSPHVAADFAF